MIKADKAEKSEQLNISYKTLQTAYSSQDSSLDKPTNSRLVT
jgi:hypothetical protein